MEYAKENSRSSYIPLDNEPENSSRTRPLSSAEQVLLQSQTTSFWGASWTLEILGCLTSIAFFVAIVVVLWCYDGQPMPDWPYGITLNALVSVLSTIMKATMAFVLTESLAQLKWSWFSAGNRLSDLALLDAASRGAMGAVIVLFRFLPRHLVTLGCLVLVIATATDPFVQQVLGIVMRPVHAHGQSSIQICNTSLYNDYGEGVGPGLNEVPLGTAGAIYSGLFQTQSPDSNNAMVNCPTGNCTFPPYQTLGFCSRCANITDSLSLSKTPMGPMVTSYDYRLPNGLSFTTSQTGMYRMNATSGLDLLELDVKDKALIINFTAISAAGYGVPPQISATECSLYFCVDTFTAAVKDGVFSENRTLVSTASNSSLSNYAQDIALTPDTCYSDGKQYEKPYKSGENCTYNVNWVSRIAMQTSLAPLLRGNGQMIMSNRQSWSSNTVKALYGMEGNFTDINSVFNSLSSTLTLNARSKICKSTILGKAWTVQSFVHVRWLWLILPGALVVLSTGFLVTTIVHTRNQYIWKSSPLALLFSDLLVDAPTPLRPDPTLRGMENTSRNMEVLLETSREGGVKLKTVPTL